MRTLQLTEKDGQLILQNSPMFVWMFGGVGAAVLCLAGVVFPAPAWALIVIGVLIALFAASVKAIVVRINPPKKTVSIRRYNLFKYEVDVYSFDELSGELYIKDVVVNVDANTDRTFHKLFLPLKSGDDVEIVSETTFDSQIQDIASRINAAIAEHRPKLP